MPQDLPRVPSRFLITGALCGLAGAAQGQTIAHEPTRGVPTFSVRGPVLRLMPGAVVGARTFRPGEVGKLHIEGASPGDTLVVKVAFDRNQDVAISSVTPGGISGVAGDSRTRLLNDPLPGRRFVWRLGRARNVGITDLPNSAIMRMEIPLRPMLGRVATAPAGEEEFGGLWVQG